MDVQKPKYSVAEFCRLTGIEPMRLRDWRRRGIITGIGYGIGDRWLYSIHDLMVMSTAQLFRNNGLDIGRAVWSAFICIPFLHQIKGTLPDPTPADTRFIAIWTQDETDSFQGMCFAPDLANLEAQLKDRGPVAVAHLIDLHAILQNFPEWLNTIIRGELVEG